MQPLKCSLGLMLALGLFHMSTAMPGRYLRAADNDAESPLVTVEFADDENDLNPINEATSPDVLDRNKRKITGATFEAKNAVLGFVFGKIDNFLDTNIRILEQLDRANIEKNKQWDIPKPVPVNDVQSLITAVVSPKIRAVGNIANDLTTGVLTTITAFSGSSSGGNSNNPNAGLGNIVSKVLGFSGPILQGSSGGAGAGGSTTPAPDSDEAGY
ncbi:uncharacterized protein LOC106089809 isoform X1 [Stomoxys calcitrans]|uniref:Uncharacterized protein n=1 Tax=Stomoxys calcitrans TaxID=35570 RepID=A0A1I8NT34_STOCA|nr:uncharacterized protein LOC106089809 isoform X1 [Stomoxys calcitrans]XP_059224183.1 uncharacterized protein LOC106089809 isoform X1 [Stomoxys calcitrans]